MTTTKREKLGVDTEVSVAELAVLLGLSADRIYQLIRGGTLQTVKRGRLLLADSLQRYIAAINKEPISDEDMKLERVKQTAEATLKHSKAKIAKMEAEELEGKMHRSEDVEAMTADLLYAVRGALIALPGRLAVDVAQAQPTAEASEVIRQEANKVLKEISQYKYDPFKYEERVRKRMDWNSIMGDTNDDGD